PAPGNPVEPEKSYDLLAGGKRFFDVWHENSRLDEDGCASPFFRLCGLYTRVPMQVAENVDQFDRLAIGVL
ncbi:MAG: hypothetical protein ACREEM_52815, partial [Blastocatellia bacterium]